ncbi:hypothetical protein ACIBH1_48655 [Nonomuraea sp. NPDC050663]|uniref:hypothetical protein n=1 Tax=Nonomuraea sp. NPDC050663 TaxID=3364370 RepID=UPI00378C6B8D
MDLIAEAGANLDVDTKWATVAAQAGASTEQVLDALGQGEELVTENHKAAEAALAED